MNCENKKCPLFEICLTQKKEDYTCDYMVFLYNAGLLMPPEFIEKSVF